MGINVAIVEDHREFRESICFVLKSTEGFKCNGAFGSVEEALQGMSRPDVLLLDINLPGMTGIQGIPKFKAKFPDCHIIMLTVFDDDENIFEAVMAGADGYVLKRTHPLRLLQAIEDARAGGTPMSPTVARQAVALFRKFAPKKTDTGALSDREQEILSLLVQGLNNEEIAEKLFISYTTVKNHLRHIYEKMHVHSKPELLVKALNRNTI